MLRSNPLSSRPNIPVLHTQITPRFNIVNHVTRTHNPSYSSQSLSQLRLSKALTTPEHLPTLPSSTTSFGRMKSDKSISYKEMGLGSENKENLQNQNNAQQLRFPFSENQTVRSVNDIAQQFKKIISEFEDKKNSLQKNFQASTDDKLSQKSFNKMESCYVIRQTTQEYNSSINDECYENQRDFIPWKMEINRDQEDTKMDGSQLWRQYLQKKQQMSKNSSLTSTFGNTGWRKSTNSSSCENPKGSFSNKQFPFFIIDLKLPEKTQQVTYIPSIPVSEFASHLANKFNIDASHVPYISQMIQDHLDRNSIMQN